MPHVSIVSIGKWQTSLVTCLPAIILFCMYVRLLLVYDFSDFRLLLLYFYSKTDFWPSYCHTSTDLDKILHTPIALRNTLQGRLRPRSASGRLQAKTSKRLFFAILVTHPNK